MRNQQIIVGRKAILWYFAVCYVGPVLALISLRFLYMKTISVRLESLYAIFAPDIQRGDAGLMIGMLAFCIANILASLCYTLIERLRHWVRVSPAPGCHLWELPRFLCSSRAYKAVFEPLLAEFQYEYFEALYHKRPARAAWVRVLYFFAFWKAAGLNIAMKLASQAWKIFRGA